MTGPVTRNGDPPGDRGEDDSADEGTRSPDRNLQSEALPPSVECPFCSGWETEQFAAFGSAVSTSQYYCRRCRTVFEFMKWRR